MSYRHLLKLGRTSLHVRCQQMTGCFSSSQYSHFSTAPHMDVADSAMKSCWNCGQVVEKCSLFCSNDSCKSILACDCHCNYFDLLNIPVQFNLSKDMLDKNFKNHQRKLHPDLHASKTQMEKDASASSSACVNQAYQTLLSPVSRAKYLLNMKGIHIMDEGGRGMQGDDGGQSNPATTALMMDVFEMREEVEECQELTSLTSMHSQLSSDIDAVCMDLQQSLHDGDLKGLEFSAVKLKYLTGVHDEIVNKIDAISDA